LYRVDNSENSRNGDYLYLLPKVLPHAHLCRPSRFEAQSDAVGLIFSAKTNANAESSVGLMSMAGNGPTVLTTLTTDMGRILDGLHRTKIEGYSDFTLSLNIAAVSTASNLGHF
jgi:26S proteasome regulatory subunit N10